MPNWTQLFPSILHHRTMVLALASRNIESRYVGTLGGALWALVHPIASVALFYFVFTIGFRAQGPANAPFILWFVCGLVPWFFFSETLAAITSSVTQNAHLVKKMVFPTEILPVVHLLSCLLPHAIFMLLLIGMMVFFRIPFSADRLAIVYYIICTSVLLLGTGWLLAALQVFYRDIAQGLTIVLNLLFWTTPIVWSPESIPAGYRSLLFFNPVHYLVDGYRDLLIYHTVIWPDISATVYFWLFAAPLFVGGAYVFHRLKPEFPDVM